MRCSLTTIWRTSVAALLLAALLAGCDGGGPKFKNTDITGAGYGTELSLTGHDGKPRTLADFRGKVVVLFFGYTHCPDVCPTTLSELSQVMKSLGSDADRVQVQLAELCRQRSGRSDVGQVLSSLATGDNNGLIRPVGIGHHDVEVGEVGFCGVGNCRIRRRRRWSGLAFSEPDRHADGGDKASETKHERISGTLEAST